jgi:hypothetical protein
MRVLVVEDHVELANDIAEGRRHMAGSSLLLPR